MDIRLSVDALDPGSVDWDAVARRANPPYLGRWFFRGVLGWPHRTMQRRAFRRANPRA